MFIISDSSSGNVSAIFFKDKQSENLRTLLPRKKFKRSFGAYHPKLSLIKFKDKLRVVIGSGNLSTGDWLIWSNAYFKLDFPLKFAPKNQKRAELADRIINQTVDGFRKNFRKQSKEKSQIKKRMLDRTIDALVLKGSHFVHNEITTGKSKKTQFKIDSQYEKGFMLPLSQMSFALNSQLGTKSRGLRSQKNGSVMTPNESKSRAWKRRIFEYQRELAGLGYDFKSYLLSYLNFSMKEYFPQMKTFLNIDLEDYEIEVNDFYLVGSLPGNYQNHINNNPKLLKQSKPEFLGGWGKNFLFLISYSDFYLFYSN